MIETPKFPAGTMGLPLDLVEYPTICGLDQRPGSYDCVLADAARTSNGGRALRPIFVGKLQTEDQIVFSLIQYRAVVAVMDIRPEMDLAKRVQERCAQYGIKVWLAEYKTTPTPIEMTRNEHEGIVSLQRTMTLDAVQFMFKTGSGVVLPQNFREITESQFASEMTASTKVPEKWHGQESFRWDNTGPDHAFHAFNLMNVAYKLSGLAQGFGGGMIAERGIVEGSLNDNLDDLLSPIKRAIRGDFQSTGVYLEG